MKQKIIIINLLLIINMCKPAEEMVPGKPVTKTGVTDTEIIIGSSSALSGHASFLGKQLTQGSLALIQEVNNQGGVYGRKIKLIKYDDKYNPSLTESMTNKLIYEDQVFMLFDYVGTPTSKKIIYTVNKAQIPVLGLFTGAEFLRNPFQPYIINIRASYFKEVETIVDYWIKNKKTKIAVFIQDDAFGAAVLDGVELALARHTLVPVIIGKFTRGQLPETEVVQAIVAKKPAAIVMVGTYSPLALFVKMAKESGLPDAEFHTVSFVGSKAFARELVKLGSGVEENVYVTQVVPSPFDKFNKAAVEFRDLYKKYYPEEEPNYVAFEGYINAKILIKALSLSGLNLSREKFISVIETMSDYNAGTGLQPDIASTNHNFFEDVKISRIIDSKFQVIQ